MKRISHKEYLILRQDADIYSKDPWGDKVLYLRNGSFIKLFRIKHLISSARLYPYSLRFVKNAKKLFTLNIPTIEIIELFNIPSIKRTAVQYKKLEGDTLPSYLSHRKFTDTMAQEFGTFISSLHNKGVYFRSIHLENVIVLPNKNFGLIDVSDMKIHSRSLSPRKRNANFRHLTRYDSHRDLLKQKLIPFLQAYLEQTNFSEHRRIKLKKKLLKHFYDS